MVNLRSGPRPPSFLFIWDQARWVNSLSVDDWIDQRPVSFPENSPGTHHDDLGVDGLESLDSFIESENLSGADN